VAFSRCITALREAVPVDTHPGRARPPLSKLFFETPPAVDRTSGVGRGIWRDRAIGSGRQGSSPILAVWATHLARDRPRRDAERSRWRIRHCAIQQPLSAACPSPLGCSATDGCACHQPADRMIEQPVWRGGVYFLRCLEFQRRLGRLPPASGKRFVALSDAVHTQPRQETSSVIEVLGYRTVDS
jgi:hypothetical protein